MQFININIHDFLLYMLVSLSLSLILNKFFIHISKKFNYVDYPKEERKIHTKPIPYGGGIAIFISFLITLFIFWNNIFGNKSMYELKEIYGILIGSLIIIIVGFLGDKYNTKKIIRILLQLIAILIIVISGIGIDYISSPFGGIINLDTYKIPIQIGNDFYHLVIISDIITILWILILVNSINIIDGVDGLAGSISAIAFATITILSLTSKVNQIDTASIAFIMFCSIIGFLFFNFSNAKIYLGDAGAMFLGFMIATLSILSGSKIATAFLVLGIPIIDFLWTIIRRIKNKKNIFTPDKDHIHHLLLSKGFKPIHVTLTFICICILFGFIALLTETTGKIISIIILFFITLILYIIITPKKLNNK